MNDHGPTVTDKPEGFDYAITFMQYMLSTIQTTYDGPNRRSPCRFVHFAFTLECVLNFMNGTSKADLTYVTSELLSGNHIICRISITIYL